MMERWLEVATNPDDEIGIYPDAINKEANGNMYVFSPNKDENPTIGTVTAFVEQVIRHRRERLLNDYGGHPMTFYCWHDWQARQFRFSLVSQSHARLPFGCAIRETDDLTAVIEQIVEQDWNNERYMQSELDEDVDENGTVPGWRLDVYATRLP